MSIAVYAMALRIVLSGSMRDNESYVKVGAVKCRTCMPRSRFSQFNALALDRALRGQGTGYASFGAALGGRPEDRSCYDAEGHVRYDRLAATPSFLGGIERLEKASRHRCVGLLCAEEAPERCHRHLLIARVLVSCGDSVAHLTPPRDGRVLRGGL